MKIFLPSIVLAFLLSACSLFPEHPALDHAFTLKYRQSAVIETGDASLRLKFTELIEESRCPPNATCIHAGRAIVGLTADKEKKLKLGYRVNPNISGVSSSVWYRGFHIQLLDVSYKKDHHYGKATYYTIKLLVEKP